MIYIKGVNGVKIAVYDYNPGGKETVFLVHGWPLSGKMYEYQTELLLRRGYRVVVIDLRGFGKSDVPAYGYSYDLMSEDIYCIVKALGLRAFILVGFSMGGAIVLRYMRRFRGYGVKKLILLSAAAPCWTQRENFPYGLTKDYVDGLIYLASTDRPQLCRNFSRQLFSCPHSEYVINWFEGIALEASGVGTIQTAVSLRDEDGRQDLKCVNVPARIIYGMKDQVVDPQLISTQHREIKGSKLYTLSDSGHGIVYDQLKEFNKYFLEAIMC